MSHFNILDLPPEIITEIFTYLSCFDISEASLVCRLWLTIGQQHKFSTNRYLKFTHCNLNDETEPGKVFINTGNVYYRMQIGKSCFVSSNSFKLFRKLGETITHLELTGNLEWQNGLLIRVLAQFPVLQNVEIGSALADQINTKSFVDTIFRGKFKHITLHGLTQTFIEHFFHIAKELVPQKSVQTTFCFFFNCDFDSRGRFDLFFETVCEAFPQKKMLELTVPFKVRDLQMLALDTTHLKKLEITSPKSFEDLKNLCQLMQNLQELVIWRGCLDFQLFNVFDHLVNLEVLRIQSGLRFTQEMHFCQNLQPKPKMRVLDIELIEGQINDEGFMKLIKAMPNLMQLTLNQSEIRDEHLHFICDNLRKLEILDIDFAKITDSGLLHTNMSNLKTLKSLRFKGGYGITSSGFSKFSELHFQEMKDLSLNYFLKIDTTAIKYVVTACPYIEHLSLDGCSEIDDSTINIISRLRRLRQLDLFSCPNVTTKAIKYLTQNRLQFLDLSALNINDEEKQELYQKIPKLRYIFDYNDEIDKSKYFKGKTLIKRELYCTIVF